MYINSIKLLAKYDTFSNKIVLRKNKEKKKIKMYNLYFEYPPNIQVKLYGYKKINNVLNS